MHQGRIEPLIEAVYDAAVDPEGWTEVMSLIRQDFSTGAETFYFLDYRKRSMRPVHVSGISDHFLQSFEACFYTADNPSTQVAALHRPGVIRTDQCLAEHFRDAGILQRSQYYNEWLRPQDFGHTMGMTPWAGDGIVLNLSLLRSSEIGAFRPKEIARFRKFHAHLRRALRVAIRLETLTEKRSVTAGALDHLPHGVVFVNSRGKVLHCNSVAEKMIRPGIGLAIRSDRLVATDHATQRQLAALLQRSQGDADGAEFDGAQNIIIQRPGRDRPLILSAIRLSPRRNGIFALQPTVMLLIVDPGASRSGIADLLHTLYRLTPAEARLAQVLLAGGGLRQAAATAGMTYETARWYLKILFQKTETSRQAELVARLMADLAGAPCGPDDNPA
ncbi:MAG: helix-turn-helix transcriptional regulator [Kiloniellaceae bacterium]